MIGKEFDIYKKYTSRSTVTYSKNGVGITKQVWDEEANNVTLKRN